MTKFVQIHTWQYIAPEEVYRVRLPMEHDTTDIHMKSGEVITVDFPPHDTLDLLEGKVSYRYLAKKHLQWCPEDDKFIRGETE